MSDFAIIVRFGYYLGGVASILTLAYYATDHFDRLEMNVDWLVETLHDLTVRAENVSAKLFQGRSPASLTFVGHLYLEHSGLKSYIDERGPELVRQLQARRRSDIGAIQDAAFRLVARMTFDPEFERSLSEFAFDKDVSTDLLRRIGAIYLCDLAAGRA